MEFSKELVPRFVRESFEKYDYPHIDSKKLWELNANEFNEWRRKYDFPRITSYFQKNLNSFVKWQKEQKVTDADLNYFGPAKFLKETKNTIYVVEFYKNNVEDNKRIVIGKKLIKKYKSREDFYGKFKINKRVTPYFSWAKKNKIIPHKDLFHYNLNVTSKRSTLYGGDVRDVRAYILKELRLLNLGEVKLENHNICGAVGGGNSETKNFEFTCLDGLYLEKCYTNSSIELYFSSAENMTFNSDVSFIRGYNTSFNGLKVMNSNLQSWELENCQLEGKSCVSNSKIWYWKSTNSGFFDYFNSIKILDSEFVFPSTSESSFKHMKNIYASQGDFYNAGKYFYSERKANLILKLNFYKYNERNLPLPKNGKIPNNIKAIISFFKNKNTSYSKNTFDLVYLIFFRILILFKPKYFLLFVKNYVCFFINFLDYLIRGFGEKPFRIVISSFLLISLFAYIDFSLFNFKNFTYLDYLHKNLLNFIGQGTYQNLNNNQLILKIVETFVGIFLIGLFIADFSSKRKY